MTKSNSKIYIKESLTNSLIAISGHVCFLGFIWYTQDLYIGNIGASVFYAVLGLDFCYLVFRVFKTIKRETIIALDTEGLYHKDYKLLKWNDILSIKKTRKQIGDSESVLFLIQTP